MKSSYQPEDFNCPGVFGRRGFFAFPDVSSIKPSHLTSPATVLVTLENFQDKRYRQWSNQ